MSLSWFSRPFEITPEKNIMATRVGLGVIISFVITTYFEIVDPTWVYISLFAILLEQKTIGASIIRGSMRGLATLSSAIFSLTIIFLFNNNYLTNLMGCILGTFIYTYFFSGTKKSYIGVLGSVTLAICLINNNDFTNVFIRPTNVIIGIIIGSLIQRFFFPKRATKMLLLEIQKFLTEYAAVSHYLANMNNVTTHLRERFMGLESTMTHIPLFQTLLGEATVEIHKNSPFTNIAADILVSIRHIFRYYASIIDCIIYEEIKIDEDDKNNLLFLHQTLTQLNENITHVRCEHKLIMNAHFPTKEDKNLLPLMLHLIILECSSLEININKLITVVKILKLE